jgi:hypothetical protein
VAPERTPLSSRQAARHQFLQGGSPSLFNPTGFLCMVAADGDLLCVLAKCREEARRGQDFHNKSFYEIMLVLRTMLMNDVCTRVVDDS